MDVMAKLQQVDESYLTTVVRQALERDDAVLKSWQVERIHYLEAGFNILSSSIHRLSGVAASQGEELPWSVIVKHLQLPEEKLAPDGTVIKLPLLMGEPSAFTNWKREPLAFSSGLLDTLNGPLIAPRCFGVVEPNEREVAIWMENVSDSPQGAWPLEQYAVAAHHLGVFNGTYLQAQTIPDDAWLCRQWLRSWLGTGPARVVPMLAERPEVWQHPLVQAAFPQPVGDRVVALWEARETLLKAIESLPVTLCHMDAFRQNLFVRQKGDAQETVAIDWAFIGLAAPGEEVAPLIIASLLREQISMADAVALQRTVLESYLKGLAEAGWNGDPAVVRFAYAAAAALRYTFIILGTTFWGLWDKSRAERLEQQFERPFAETLKVRAELVYFLLALGDEALALQLLA